MNADTHTVYELHGELKGSIQGVEDAQTFIFIIQRERLEPTGSTNDPEYVFKVRVTDYTHAWASTVSLRHINKMILDQGPNPEFNKVMGWLRAAVQHPNARLCMQDGEVFIKGFFEFSARSLPHIRLPPKGSLEQLDDGAASKVFNEISRLLLSRLREATADAETVRRQLEQDAREHQQVMAEQQRTIKDLEKEKAALKERVAGYEGKSSRQRDDRGSGGTSSNKRQRTEPSAAAPAVAATAAVGDPRAQAAPATQAQASGPNAAPLSSLGATQALGLAAAAAGPPSLPLSQGTGLSQGDEHRPAAQPGAGAGTAEPAAPSGGRDKAEEEQPTEVLQNLGPKMVKAKAGRGGAVAARPPRKPAAGSGDSRSRAG